MKLQTLLIALVAITLTSCQCMRSDSSCSGSEGSSSCHGGKGVANAATDRVFFEFDQSSLSDAAKDTLDHQGKALLADTAKEVKIVGHCDSRGTSEYNIALGERRAHAAKEYLVDLGVNGKRLSVTSVGKEQPIVEGENEAAWAQNRVAVVTDK